MPFGLKNAPATFQCLMNMVLAGQSGCAAYLDDVVVFSDTWDTHVQRLKAVFGRLAEANLTVNLAKCDFAKATVTYLGKVVGQGEVRPVQAKVERGQILLACLPLLRIGFTWVEPLKAGKIQDGSLSLSPSLPAWMAGAC